MTPYDAIVVLGFGGPEGPDDVMPFLRNVTKGRGVPDERLAVVAEQYALFDGVSPINEQNRALVAAIDEELVTRGRQARSGGRLPVVLGNRNWDPFLEDTFARLVADGAERVLAIATSAYSSYSSCRQYHEDVARAVASVDGALAVDRVRPFWNHPGFITTLVERVTATVDGDAPDLVLFTAHSIPQSMASTSDYEAQLRDAATLIIDRVDHDLPWELVFQSRSGPPQVPWLEPDVADRISELDPGSSVVVVPVGFVSDHMEVLYDLDVLAKAAADDAGVRMRRAPAAGTAPSFVAGVADLLDEWLVDATPVALGPLGVRPRCAADCCPAPKRPGRP